MKKNKIPQTICLIHEKDKILLGMKKRGFGAGRWNGFGGKVKPGETIEGAAEREMLEECGIKVRALHEVGVIDFEFEGKPDMPEVHILRATEYSGEPRETEEMLPKWFKTKKIPFDKMWPDDIYWLPLFLKNKNFRGYFLFGENDAILKKELHEEVIYNKLIRDKIPEICAKDGWVAETRILNSSKYLESLKEKILEEAEELNTGKSKENLVEELADIQEIIDAILTQQNIKLSDFRKIQTEKRQKRGGFKKKLFLNKTIREVE